jgi:threonine dehydratase
VVAQHVDEIILVSERQLEWAVGALVEQQRVVAEGAGAAGIAAIYGNPALFAGKKVGVVICGGNIDPRLLASILNRNMAVDGRIARLRIDIADEPGMLGCHFDGYRLVWWQHCRDLSPTAILRCTGETGKN